MPLIGGSPLGLSFFSDLNYINKLADYVSYEKPSQPISTTNQSRTTGYNGGSPSNANETDLSTNQTGNAQLFASEIGLGYRTFGDIRSNFTHDEKNPASFYVYDNRNTEDNPEGTLLEYIRSQPKDLYNSDYTDKYSSISKIVDALQNPSKRAPSLKMNFHDFAYLKKLGVYPSNRLILARRFAGGADDDLVKYTQPPQAIIPSWVEDGVSPVSISYGESWGNLTTVNLSNEKSAAGVFSEFGWDSSKVAAQLNSFAGGVSLPGFTEWLQYYFFNQAGLTDLNNLQLLPQGNPNLIRQAVRRKTAEDGTTFEGLNYLFSINIKTEYEIKYIDGIDPTLVYFDIISNLLRFGTSDAQFQFDSRFNDKARSILEKLTSGDAKIILEQVQDIIKSFAKASAIIVSTVWDKIIDLAKAGLAKTTGTPSLSEAVISSQIKKYRLQFVAIIQALTGSPSGIYHVTIGHPLRPIFSSGDLYPSSEGGGAKITLGPELGYNNLPTTISFDVTLRNARACGLQEIYKKFSPRPVLREAENIANFQNIDEEDSKKIIFSSRIRRVNPLTQIQTSNSPISGFAGDFVPLPVGLS